MITFIVDIQNKQILVGLIKRYFIENGSVYIETSIGRFLKNISFDTYEEGENYYINNK